MLIFVSCVIFCVSHDLAVPCAVSQKLQLSRRKSQRPSVLLFGGVRFAVFCVWDLRTLRFGLLIYMMIYRSGVKAVLGAIALTEAD